jgi:hypothetical protein
MTEFHTTVRAEVYLTLRSDRPLTKEGVYDILSECHYEFGSGDEGFGLGDGKSAHICATQWEDNEITRLNDEVQRRWHPW